MARYVPPPNAQLARLRDDVTLEGIAEEGRGRHVDRQVEEGGQLRLHVDVGVGVGLRSLVRLDLHLALEGLVDDRRAGLARAAQARMQRVEQPAQKVHRVRLRADLVTVVRLVRDRLQELVRYGGGIGEIQARYGGDIWEI